MYRNLISNTCAPLQHRGERRRLGVGKTNLSMEVLNQNDSGPTVRTMEGFARIRETGGLSWSARPLPQPAPSVLRARVIPTLSPLGSQSAAGPSPRTGRTHFAAR